MAHTLLLLTGKDNQKKTALISLMRKTKEIGVGAEVGEKLLLENIEYYETVVFTYPNPSKMLTQLLEDFSKKHNLTFLNLDIS